MIPKPSRAHMSLLAFQHLISMRAEWLWWWRGRLWLWPRWELSVTRGHHCWWLLPVWEKPLGSHPNLRLNNTEPITTSAFTAAHPLTGRLSGENSAEIWCKDWWHSVFCGDKGRLVPGHCLSNCFWCLCLAFVLVRVEVGSSSSWRTRRYCSLDGSGQFSLPIPWSPTLGHLHLSCSF